MDKLRYNAICAVVVGAACVLSCRVALAADDNTSIDQTEEQLIGVLQSDTPAAEKAISCKRLAVVGTANAVPALARLLSDERLASWSRIALEAIPDPAADAALLSAVKELDGRLLVGVINSIGVRRHPGAVGALSQHLSSFDPAVASAAAVALGRIGNEPARESLESALAVASAGVRSAVAEGCIYCAEALLVAGDTSDAARLYDKVRQADVNKQRLVEATRGAILARQEAGIPLLIEQLESPDKEFFSIGLSTARELSGSEITNALVGYLGKTKPERQALLLSVLADRGDSTALPAVLELAAAGPNEVRIAAMQAAARLGDTSCIAELLNFALEADAEVVQAAKQAVEVLPGNDVDADLVARLADTRGKMRRLVVELIGNRRITDAVPMLIEAADNPDAKLQAAALAALGNTIEQDDLSVLVERVVDPRRHEDAEAAARALHSAAVRMPDRETCALELAAAMSQAPVPAQCTILEILGSMGGAEALRAIATAARDSRTEIQDTISRELGEWMTVEAAPVLMDLAKSAPDARYRTRALRGYIRLARQFSMPEDQRAQMCRQALQTATRDDEKKLALEVLKRHPNVHSLQVAAEAVRDPSVKDAALGIVVAIAEKM